MNPSLILDIVKSLTFLKHKDLSLFAAIEEKIVKNLNNLTANQLALLLISYGEKYPISFEILS